jgi:hypothetical protein
MNCHDAHELLQQSLDGTPIESPEWLAHLRQCGDCRALAAAGRRLQDGLRLLAAPSPPADLVTRIAERVLLDRRRACRRARRRWAVSLALATGLFVALALRLDWRGLPTGTEVHPPAPVVKNTPTLKEKPAPTLRESAAELGEVFTALSNQTADETVGQTRRWVSAATLSPEFRVLTDATPNSELRTPNSELLQAAGEGVSEGLEPVTTSARRAVGLFLRELPMETEPNGL